LFSAEPATIRKYLKRWIGYDCPEAFTIDTLLQDIIDWDYYLDRLAKKVTKIVILPYERQKEYITRKEIHDDIAKLKVDMGVKQTKKEATAKKASGGLMKFVSTPGETPATSMARHEKSKPQFKENIKVGKSYDLREFL
jgi:ribosomal protein L5